MSANLKKLLQKAYEEDKAAHALPPEKAEEMRKAIFATLADEKKSEGNP